MGDDAVLSKMRYGDVRQETGQKDAQDYLLIDLIFGVLYLRGGLADARKGMPFQDERTKKILLYAGAKAFTLSIWGLLVLMYIADQIEIIPRHVAAAGIAGMALLFFISWIWYDKRGVPE
jgi:hypothetical protein